MKSLTIDAGNSQIAVVAYEGNRRMNGVRLWTHPLPAAESIARACQELISALGWNRSEVSLCVSCVVPTLELTLRRTSKLLTPHRFHWVNWESPHPFQASESARQEIGADLIAGLMGAREFGKQPLVVVDCGTATTLTVVDSGNYVLGVAILPGLETQLKSLTQSAPHLPQEVSLQPPSLPYGNDTHEALQSGILYGHAAAVEGLIARYRSLFPEEKLTALGCGGLFHRISSLCPSVEISETELVNIGCRMLLQSGGEERF